MIVKMHKYAFLVYHVDYSAFLDQMKSLGVLHIIESKNEPSPQMQDDLRESQDLSRMISFLENRYVGDAQVVNHGATDGRELMNAVKNTQGQLESLEQHKSVLEKELRQFEPWGNFSWESIEQLQEVGVDIRFFQCAASKYNAGWEDLLPISVVSDEKNYISFVVFLRESDVLPDMDAEEVKLPFKSLAGIEMELRTVIDEIAHQEKLLDQYAMSGIDLLKAYQASLTDRLQTEMAVLHTSEKADGSLMQLEGFVPAPRVADVEAWLNKSGVVYLSSEAQKEDRPPILLKNGPFAKLFEPIGKLFALPAYMELDLTPFFAPFFLLFFGFCLGDAGYGLLFAIGATVARYKLKGSMKPYMALLQWLGLSTVLFGALTGTFFGVKLINLEWPALNNLQQMMLSDDQMFNFALGLGFVQIIFGMILKGINQTIQDGFTYSFATWGWIVVIVSTAVMFALDQLFGPLHLALLGISALGIFVFNHPKRNVLVNIGAGLWDSYNMVTGFAGDLLSYIRLFALGLSSGILGLVFNKLAFELSPDIPVLNVIITGLILIVGHGLNIFMSALGSFVHPMRLTFVEFFKNAGFAGGGKAYSPFQKSNQ